MANYYVYILFNHTRTLYVGVTNDLLRRLSEHRLKVVPGFTARYNITMLAYYERYSQIGDAIRREKELKKWSRAKKIRLIESKNPGWEDLWNHLHDRDVPEVVPGESVREGTGHVVRGQILRRLDSSG